MWRLSDTLLREFEEVLKNNYETIASVSKDIEFKWEELPQPKNCSACGVDGSRGVEKFSGVVFYVISSVAVGREILEVHEITTLKPHKYIEERIRLHMQISEFRLGSICRDDVILMDGTLSGSIIRPPAYIEDGNKISSFKKDYHFDAMIEEFLKKLDGWIEGIHRDVLSGRARKNYLLSRTKYFDELESIYRKARNGLNDDILIFFEYLEYLHSLNKLLERDVVFVAKSFYTSEITKNSSISDSALLDYLAIKEFGYERSGYLLKKKRIEKSIPLTEYFKNLADTELNVAFIRFADFGNIYLIESKGEIDEDKIGKLRSLEFDGYLIPLIHAHRYSEIKRRELKNLMHSLLNAIKDRYTFMLKRSRGVLDR